MAKRYFEFSEGSSNKFWEVWVEGTRLYTRYGKIGASGQTTIKDEGSADGAQKLHDKLVREKTGKGYVEKGGGATAPSPAAAPKKAAPAEAAPKANAAPAVKAPVTVEPGWRRFEFSEGGSNKFWQVKVDDTTQIVRFGRIGTDGQEKEKDFDSPGEAKADTKKLIAEKTGKGYVEVGGAPPPLRNPELEAAIEKSPNDPGAYLVYADWLQGKGDPLGELIVLQERSTSSADAKKAASALLKKHAGHFLGELAEFKSRDEHTLDIEWQFGFMKSVTIGWPMFDDEGGGPDQAQEDLAALLALPTARFIQKLHLGPVPGEEMMSLEPLVEALAENKGPTTLRELYLGETGEWDISSCETGDFGALAKIFTNLEKVTLRGGVVTFGKGVNLPGLKALTIETGSLTKNELKQLCEMKAPQLESLEIWFGDPNYGASGGVKDIAPILSGAAFPKLKHLGLMNSVFSDELVKALPTAKVLKQLTSLDLSMGCLTDADLDVMLASKEAYAHLESLNLENNAMTPASKPKVKGLAKDVNFGKSQDPERVYATDDGKLRRYTAVGE